jgi:hypothetical protein
MLGLHICQLQDNRIISFLLHLKLKENSLFIVFDNLPSILDNISIWIILIIFNLHFYPELTSQIVLTKVANSHWFKVVVQLWFVNPNTGLVMFIKMSFNHCKLSVFLWFLPITDSVWAINKDLFCATFLVIIKNGINLSHFRWIKFSFFSSLKQNKVSFHA